MRQRYHTIIVVPHTRARFRKLRFTTRQLAVAAGALGFLVLSSLLVTWSLFRTTVDRAELERIRGENRAIRELNESFETSLRTLQGQLGEYEERTRDLAIVAGLDELSVGDEAGIGGVDEPITPELLSAFAERAASLETGLDRVEEGLDARHLRISSTPAIAPAKGVLTSNFGVRRDPITGRRSPHPGIDIASYPGSTVLAPADGVVVRAGRNGGLGRSVTLSHGFGLSTRYGHLARVTVGAGERVRRGDVIGQVGNSGRSTGYHLHYEVRLDGKPVNPVGYIFDPLAEKF